MLSAGLRFRLTEPEAISSPARLRAMSAGSKDKREARKQQCTFRRLGNCGDARRVDVELSVNAGAP